MKRITIVLLIGAALCGIIALAQAEAYKGGPSSAGFAVSVGLLGIGAAISEKSAER